MCRTLDARPFSVAMLSDVQGFDCGDNPWEQAQSAWITGQGVIESQKRGTKVWFYYDDANNLVGFGSLGVTKWNWPPPSGPTLEVAIIPSIALGKAYWGCPKSAPREQKYSRQIMSDLIRRARQMNVSVLCLYVHKDNVHAISLYREFDFVKFTELRKDHYRMGLVISANRSYT
jgi:hypothetical protein